MLKKFLSVLLVLMLALSLTAAAFSANVVPSEEAEEDLAKVTIYALNGQYETAYYHVGDTFTVYTTLNTDSISGYIGAVDGTQTYTNSVLELADEFDPDEGDILDLEAMFPITKEQTTANGKWTQTPEDPSVGAVYYNASTPSIENAFAFNNIDARLIVTNYTVKAAGTAEIRNTLTTLAAADYGYTKLVDKGQALEGMDGFSFRTSFVWPYQGPVILKQPENWYGCKNKEVSMSVEADGIDLEYQWFYRNSGSTKWIKTDDTDNTYDGITMNTYRDGREVKCIITDAFGNTAESDIASLNLFSLTIVTQPENWYGYDGDQVVISVEAQGDDLTYQWLYRDVNKTKWATVVGGATDTYDSITMNPNREGRQVKCRITDASGERIETDIVTLNYAPVRIVTQPQDWYGYHGEQVNISVEAQGSGLKYRWYYRNEGSANWVRTDDTDSVYDSCTMTAFRMGRQVKCIVIDAAGNAVESDIASMNYTSVAIVKQPEDWYGHYGDQINVSVEVSGTGISYQWYYRSGEGKSWVKADDYDSVYDNITMNSYRDGRQVKCVITDINGIALESDIATLHLVR